MSKVAQTLAVLLILPALWLWAVSATTVAMLAHTVSSIGRIWR